MIGQVVEIFFAAARDDFYQSAMDAGFLAEFADRRFLGLLAAVDPALRHLPRLARGIEPLADEDAAVAVGEATGNIQGYINLSQAIPSAREDIRGALTVLKAIVAEANGAP